MDKAVALEAMHHVFTVVVDSGLRVIYRSHVWMLGAQFSKGPDHLSCPSNMIDDHKRDGHMVRLGLLFYLLHISIQD